MRRFYRHPPAAGPLAAYAKRYYEAVDTPKELTEIPSAYHQFEDSDEAVEQLSLETAEFIVKRGQPHPTA